MIKKEKIDKIIKKPIKSSYSLKNINKDDIFIHPINNLFSINKQVKDNQISLSLPIDKLTKEYDKNNKEVGIYSYFHFPINQYNFTSIIYNIKNINDLEIWVNENISMIKMSTINRILYSFSISNLKNIINNIDIFINIIKKILIYYNISFDDNSLDITILNLLKDKIILNINFIDNLKKYLK